MNSFKGFDENANNFLFELQFCNTIQKQAESLKIEKEDAFLDLKKLVESVHC